MGSMNEKSRPQSRFGGDLSFAELQAMYDAQCACTDEWVAKYEAEKEKKASATLLNRIAELKSQLAEVNQRLAAANEKLTARSENEAREWLIWSNEHRAWWGPERCGYPPLAVQAGRYTLTEARAICRNRHWDDPDMPPETMIHMSEVEHAAGR